jgi:putative DNA primase/helicase
VLAILYGSGTNGKSSFIAALQHVLGDYAHQAPAEMLMHRDHGRGGATPELADLHGRRFVSAIETGAGRRFDEALIKQLTGGDKIRARQLYAHPFTFQPTHKLWLATNHRPEVHGTDEAIWRRLLLIPFEVTIPPEKQEDQTRVVERLAGEAAGILAWAVQGCLEWHLLGGGGYQGLDVPDRVKAAIAEYRADMDTVAAFLEECCVVHPDAKTKSSDLYNRYGYWAAANGADAVSQRAFSLSLRGKGYERAKRMDGAWFLGVTAEHHSPMEHDA